MKRSVRREQEEICRKYRVPWVEAPSHLKVGIAENVKTGLLPINGLRHSPDGDTTGWYIWAGEGPSSDPEFFKPLHVEHLQEWCGAVVPFLGLPPGSRFQIAPDHEDVWEDTSLLDTSRSS
jgi:hypothetical protein